MGRPKENAERIRMTVLLSAENDEFVRRFAQDRAINLSTAINILLAAILRDNKDTLREARIEHSNGRQF